MQTYEIRDGIVQNQIVIQPSQRAYYERLTGCTLVDAEDVLPIMIGDTYDAETGAFSREGAPLGDDVMRAVRDQLLAKSDFTQLLDYPCTDEARDAWRVYRQDLRDLTNSDGWPHHIVWPTPPSNVPGERSSMQQIIDELLGRDAQ